MINVKRTKTTRLCQGDIIRNVEHIEYISEKDGIIEISKIEFPLVIILTQDCDLEQDYRYRKRNSENKDKLLISVLVAPLYNSEHIFSGEHLSELHINSQYIKKTGTKGKLIIQNQIPRYHYIHFPEKIDIVSSIIDFKHYFSVNTDYLKKLKRTNFVCMVSELYRESISTRFAFFLSRIGLPDINKHIKIGV